MASSEDKAAPGRCTPKGAGAIFYLYNLLLILASPVLGLMLLRRLKAGKSREGWDERWGRLRVPDLPAGPRIWVHAASVGEVSAASPVLRELKGRCPEARILMTVITPGGHETASAQVGKLVDSVHYAPFDVPWAVSRAVRAIRPAILVVLETELWPNLLHYMRNSGAPVVLINGRLSDRSFPRYLAARGLFAWVLSYVNRILTQTATDAERFRALGANPARIETIGNTKFDQAAGDLPDVNTSLLRKALKLPDEAPVLIIGSTRTAEEEQLLFRVYNRIRERIPELALIHAPRHVERAGEVETLMREAGLHPVRKTKIDTAAGPVRHLILDTFGELATTYAVADVTIIGNSLTPPGGGQNLLQPLALGKPVVYGPYMQNFRDIAAMAETGGVGFIARTEEELETRLLELLEDRTKRANLGGLARELVDANQGASARYAEAIMEMLDAKGSPRGH